ncbi:MAG TPA: alpha/beta hydrolase [Candidatus Dormibacteraeota bacterium]|nr:alpha/beta hydrolase [Candidatus Dormibacteraeota bacterium]
MIDPDAQRYLDETAALDLPSLAVQGPVEARRHNHDRAPSLAGAVEEVALVRNGRLPGPAGELHYRLYSPLPDEKLPALLYLHGGGWVYGDIDTHDSVCRGLARRADCAVLSLDYRLAPENPFPAAVEDAWAGLEWLHQHARDIGGDPDRLAVAGDSAGGNLSAVLALRARDRGGPRITAQVLIYPVTDCDFNTTSYREKATGYGLTSESMFWFWDNYVAEPARRTDPDASPMRATDHRGLAPALIITCELDPLASEGVAYADLLERSGVSVEHIHELGMIHGYIRMAGVTSRTRKSWDDCARFLRQQFRSSD